MIIPLTEEPKWLEVLAGLPTWQPPSKRTIVLSPHPDDETLGAGGLIAWLKEKDVEVVVVAVTDGERAYLDAVGLGETRVGEQTAALHRLGVSANAIHRLRLTDSGLDTQEEELALRLSPLIDSRSHVIAPWPHDFHPDHEACGRAAEHVAHAKGAQLTFYFFWTWHRGGIDMLKGLPLVALPLNENHQLARREALVCHQSQLQREHGDPILSSQLLRPAQRPFEVFLPA